MLKRIILILVASLLTMGTLGCACSGQVAAPTPTASIKPAATPSALPASTPDVGMNASASPDLSGSPDAGTGTGTGTGGAIENFKEGTEVQVENVPEVKKAVEEKYAGATIKTIKHATKDGQQVYAVEIDVSGKTQTVYVSADGKLLEGNTVS